MDQIQETNNSKAPKYFLYILGILIILGFVYVIYSAVGSGSGEYDAFAKCLTENGVKFYGAYWCLHCTNQKEMFGKSFKYLKSVECSLPNNAGQTKECSDADIKGYPTWEFKDGQRMSGKLSFEQLSQLSGCKL